MTFSDYLRALVTADTELNPDDPYDLRANLVDAFLARGIHPSGVFSANEESLLWDAPAPSIVADNLDPRVLDILAGHQSEQWGATSKSVGRDWNYVKEKLHDWADGHHAALQMEPDSRCPIEVEGFQSMFRVGSDGQLLTEAGVQFVQTSPAAQPVLGGLIPRAGTTVVFSGDGSARYVMPKPLSPHSDNTPDAGDPRMKALTDFVRECDERDPHYPWVGEAYDPKERMLRRFNFALVHQGIRRTARAKEVSGNGG